MTASPISSLTADATSRVLDSDGLHYHLAGDGPGLLLLHGSGPGVSGWANFGANVDTFARGRTVVIPDLPGYGGSTAPNLSEPYMQAAGDAALRILDAVGLERVDVLGNSLGGAVAVHLALDHPDRVRRLVLMGPGGIAPPLLAPLPTEGIKLLMEFLHDPVRPKLVAWMRAMVGDQAFLTEELIEERWQRASSPGALDFTKAFYDAAMARAKAPTTETPVYARLGAISHPTLLTYGRDDRVTPLEGGLHALRNLQRAELHVFPHCGHWAMQERKTEFERIVTEFLTRPE